MLTKLTCPDVKGALVRDRLFSQLDLACTKPIIWISAPAGAGKTTLVSSYIESRRLNKLWYQVDEGDADMATFFHYLGQALKNASSTRKKMPVLTPEFQLGIPQFTRNYFRELFSSIKPPAILVLDNFQDAGQESDLLQLLPDALEEVSKGINVIIISRTEPPKSFARLRANQYLSQVTWSDIQFTLDEQLAITKKRHPDRHITKQQLQNINTHIQGWITGLILLLEQDITLDEVKFENEDLSPEYLFDYFASEVFYKADTELQDFLLKTSFLLKMNATVCKKLTGNKRAKNILSNLVRKQYFTMRTGLINPSYEYHPLFRDFLQNQAQNKFNQNKLRDIQDLAGILLADAGDLDVAINLLIQSKNWITLAKLLLKHVKNQINKGRNKKVIQWIESLPDNVLVSEPWLIYWLAIAYLQYNNTNARDNFEKSYFLFSKLKDVKGQYLSWCGVADSYIFAHSSFVGAKKWIAILEQLQKSTPLPLNIEVRGHLALSVAGLLLWAQPTHKDLHYWHNKIELMFNIIPSQAISIMCASQLSIYYSLTGQVIKLRHCNKKLESYNSQEKDASFLSIVSYTSIYLSDWMMAEYKLDNKTIDNYHQKTKNAGINVFSGLFNAYGMYIATCLQDDSRLEHLLKVYEKDERNNNELDQAHYYLHKCNLELLRKDFEKALYFNKISAELVDKTLSPFPQWTIYATQAYIYTEKKQFELAINALDSVRPIVEGMNSYLGLYASGLIYSYISLQQGNIQLAVNQLNSSFELGCKKEIRSAGIWPVRMIATLCAFALEHNIEPAYTKSIIKIYKYTPNDSLYESTHWPYPIKIYTLNRFGIIKNDKPLHPSNKVQQFLKALIALGGRDVHEETLANALWPDAEGDAAHQNFATTLHRARKLLGNDVIQLRQNQLSLNPRLCWLDIWTLKRTLSEIEKAIINNKEALPKLTEQAIKLYQGPFLGADENESWMLSAREQLSNRFLRILCKVADTFCQTNECTQALSCYQKGLEIDDLAENLYQGLMHCHSSAGNKAEGLAVYQRCHERLKTSFGIEPSSETERLHQALKDN